jgi:hypothetical protein
MSFLNPIDPNVAQPSPAGRPSSGAGRREPRPAPVRQTARVPQLKIAQDDAADELLSRDPLALLIGMLLDQHLLSGA